MTRFISIFTFILVLWISPVAAQDNNKDANTAKLEQLFQNHINTLKQQYGEDSFSVKGKILAEKAENYYAVTLPEIKINMDQGKSLNIGLIAINASPIKGSDDWKMTVALPSPFYLTNKAGEQLGQLNIGTQKFSGVYNESLQGFNKANLAYNNVTYSDLKTNDVLSIEKLRLTNDLKSKGDTWFGPTNAKAENITFGNNTKTKEALFIRNVDADIILENYNPDKTKSLSQQLVANSGNTADLVGGLLKAAGNSQTKVKIKDFAMINPETKKASFKINNIRFDSDTDVANDNKLNVTHLVQYDGLNSARKGGLFDLVPSDMQTRLTLKNLPVEDLIKAEDAIAKGRKSPQANQKAQALGTVADILKKSGAQMMLEDTIFKSALYQLNLNGNIKAASTPTGAIGNLLVEMTGLEAVMNKLQGDPIGKSVAAQLAILQIISEKKGDKNVIDIKAGEDGKILVNGKDMSAMSGLMSGGGS